MLDDKVDDELKLRRFAFIEACAYYIRLKASSGDWNRLVMTTELAELITERYKIYGLDWAIGGLKSYEQLLKDGMQETLPDFDGDTLDKSMVLQYNFRSMVTADVRRKEMLFNTSKPKYNGRPKLEPLKAAHTNGASAKASTVTTTIASETVAKTVTSPTSPPSPPTTTTTVSPTAAAPHDFLKGFTVFIKPDLHLDETVPICARDQHLLYNIFGDKWTSPVVLSAYTAIKGQTGFMQNWSNGEKSPK